MNKEQRHSIILQMIDQNSGEAMLTTSALAERFNVSEMTIRRDLQELSNDGLVYRQHGGVTPIKQTQLPKSSPKKEVGIMLVSRSSKYTDPFFNIVLEAADRRITQLGYRVAFIYGYDDIKTTAQAEGLFNNYPVDGVILIGTHRVESIEYVKQEVPVLVSVTESLPIDHDSILFDGRSGMFEIVKHLASLGHKRLGFVIGNTSFVDSRAVGFNDGLAEFGLDNDPNLQVQHNYAHDGWTYEMGQRGAETLMRLDNPPDAIVCASDRLAIGTMQWLHQHGLRVPEDIAVTGFDNIHDSAFTIPPLTTVHVHKDLLGSLAAERLVRRIEHIDEVPLTIITPTNLVVRQSCGYHLHK